MRVRLHRLRDRGKIVALRLVDRIVELRVDRPQPPIPGQLEREIAAPLPRPPAAEMQPVAAREQAEEQNESVVPIVIAGNGVDERA